MDEVAYYNYVCYPRYVVGHVEDMKRDRHNLIGIVKHSPASHSVIWECRGGGGFDVYRFTQWGPNNLESTKMFVDYKMLDMMNGGRQ